MEFTDEKWQNPYNFFNEFYATLPKKIASNKIDLLCKDDTWSMDLLDSIDYGPKLNKSKSYILELIGKSIKMDEHCP